MIEGIHFDIKVTLCSCHRLKFRKKKTGQNKSKKEMNFTWLKKKTHTHTQNYC
jgi:hypothetical protein